jgi:hypothetical protein
MNPITITTLTPNAVQQDLQSDGLDSLGLATLSLSTRWSDTTPSLGNYDAVNLTLNLATIRAPFRGIREFAFSPATSTLSANLSDSATTLTVKTGEGNRFPSPTGGKVLLTLTNASGSKVEIVSCTARTGDTLTIDRGVQGTAKQSFSTDDRIILKLSPGTRTSQFYDADGNTLTGDCTVFRLHPQAVLRLETLAASRYVIAGNPAVLPIPQVIVVRGSQGFSSARWFKPDEAMTDISGLISFHDGRGLILDPIYVAALFSDLQTWLPGLVGKNSTSPAGGAGGVQAIAGLATGTLVQVLDLHGRPYQPALPAATLVTRNGSGTVTGSVPASGLVMLNSGDGIDTAGSDNGRLRWGWMKNGTLGTTRIVPPGFPPTVAPAPSLGRQFYQVAVMDTVWALLGNRTATTVLGIGADDRKTPSDLLPVVRDNITINYLVDGPDVLGQSSAVLARPSQNMVLAISPVLDGTLSIPAQAGINAHWPAFPASASTAGFPTPPASPTTGISAAWTAGNDVVVTISANQVPDGASVRLYPQQFVVIPAITADPSFVRGNGGAAISQTGVVTQILLPNPFGLASGQPKPNPANLTIDIVVTPRTGIRKIWGAFSVPVAAGPVAVSPNPFAGGNLVGAIPPAFEAIAPSPLFNIPTTVAPPGMAPTGVVGLVRALASETSPRQGPRLPTMARFDTVIVTGMTGGTPAGTLLWEAVLSGGQLSPETRSALHASGNPGNPPAHDVHAPGIHVTGALAYDLARHAIRRAQSIIPLGGGGLGWVAGMGGNNFNPPNDRNLINTGIGVLLETVAAVCETPELSPLTPPDAGNSLQSMVNSAASALGISPPTVTATNEPRLQAEVRREFFVSKNGLRDTLWSLRRAVREARELIYIESPQFAHTGGTVDLVAEIITSLGAHPNLKIVICTPRESDFSQKYKGWSRQHYQARTQAIRDLLAVAPDCVAAFHAPGFPGRTAYIRTTTVIVDDVWCLSGATHWRRRGFTFDGSVAVVSCDRQMENNGYSRQVRAYRRALMATKLALATPLPGSPNADWIRLGHPATAFDLVKDLLSERGLGRIQPLWSGPADTSILPATQDMADPDGSDGSTFVTTFASLLTELGD